MELIICGVATIKGREEAFKDTVLSIINQVDKLIVYQNGYKEIFDFLNNEKIEVYSSVDTGVDMGDAGKFYKLSDYANNYYLSIDDDLIYPTDYVSNIINNLKNYNNSVIITHHGRILNTNAVSYYKDSKLKFRCLDNVDGYQAIHFPGTGVMGFHTSKVRITFDYFKIANMCDIWVGLYARENNIPIIVAPHKTGWIKHSDKFNLNNTIYSTSINNDDIQNKLIIDFNKSLIIEPTVNSSIIEPTVNINNNEICLLIPSYNRYDKLVETLTNINEYDGLNVIVYNDGSNDDRYYNIESNFKNVKVYHNSKNNGKIGYNDTVKFLLNKAIESKFNWFIYYADDMLLCKNFTTHVKKLFNDKQIVNIFSLSSGGWGVSGYIDGFFTTSKNGIKTMYNLIPNKLKDVENKSTGVWSSVTKKFSATHDELGGIKLCCLNYTLCQHYGNDDSKLHPKHRLKNPIVSHNFYDDFYGEEIKIISISSPTNTVKINNVINKKKSSEGTSSGNKITNDEPKIQEIPKPKQVIINTPISIQKPNIKKEGAPEKMREQKTINKTHNTLFMGKAMKKNLRFGRK
jgi:hypothetical protein